MRKLSAFERAALLLDVVKAGDDYGDLSFIDGSLRIEHLSDSAIFFPNNTGEDISGYDSATIYDVLHLTDVSALINTAHMPTNFLDNIAVARPVVIDAALTETSSSWTGSSYVSATGNKIRLVYNISADKNFTLEIYRAPINDQATFTLWKTIGGYSGGFFDFVDVGDSSTGVFKFKITGSSVTFTAETWVWEVFNANIFHYWNASYPSKGESVNHLADQVVKITLHDYAPYYGYYGETANIEYTVNDGTTWVATPYQYAPVISLAGSGFTISAGTLPVAASIRLRATLNSDPTQYVESCNFVVV